jgi:hypothetical protein
VISDAEQQLLQALALPDAYPHAVESIRFVETHISWVFLTGPFAYKIKKPLRLPFLDFSTLQLRERFCREELRLNRRFAPELYVDVVPIGSAGGRIRVGATPAVEFAVQMRQFPSAATADRLLANGELREHELIALAETIAVFHDSLPAATAAAGTSADERIAANLAELEAALGRRDPRTERIGRQLHARLDALGPALAARRASGAVRECHGDLHLGNVVRIDGRLTPFDCLEFDPALRTLDVVDELAFLFMDLAAHARSDLAYAYVNRYLEIRGDYPGLALLQLYAAHRALIRAKVVAIGDNEGLPSNPAQSAAIYLDYAARVLDAQPPLLVITCGMSGSGKTSVARGLVTLLPAVQIRSDVERKRLSGLAATATAAAAFGEGLYAPGTTEATYRRLALAADAALTGGVNLIVDASFLERSRREAMRELAARHGARFRIVRCVAPAATLRQRVRERAAAHLDASDATTDVLEQQLANDLTISPGEAGFTLTVDTSNPVDLAELAAAIREPS